jgi:tetratricopeptide (TPR) repeat protein
MPQVSIDALLRRSTRARARGDLKKAQKAVTQALLGCAELPPGFTRVAVFTEAVVLARALKKAWLHADFNVLCSYARTVAPPPTDRNARSISMVLLGSGHYQADMGNLEEAESQFRNALTHAEEWRTYRTLEEIRIGLSRVLMLQRSYRKAADAVLPAVKNKLLATEPSIEAYRIYGTCLIQQKRFEEAIQNYKELVRAVTGEGAKYDKIRIEAYCQIVRLLRLSDNLHATQQPLREAQALVTDDDKLGQARVLREQAAIDYQRTLYDSAIKRYEQAIELMHEAGIEQTMECAQALSDLAMCYYSLHRPAAMEPLLLASARIMRTAVGPRSLELAPVLHKLSGVYTQQGRFVEASVLISGVEWIQGQGDSLDHLMDSTRNFRQGLQLQSDGHVQKAVTWYKQALQALSRMDLGKDYETIAVNIRLYECYRDLGQHSLAESHFESAGDLLSHLFGLQEPTLFGAAMKVAAAFDIQDKDDIAESLYLYAIERASREGARDLSVRACNEYADMLERTGRAVEAARVRRTVRALSRQTSRRPKKAAAV